MGENSKDVQKKSRIAALKSEFNKIMWPDKESITKKSAAVIVATVALGVLIALVDYVVRFGLEKLL